MVAFLTLAFAALGAGTASAATWEEIHVGGEETLFGISCPTTSLCVTGGFGNVIVSSANPTGGEKSWRAERLGSDVSGFFSPGQQIRDVDCPSAGFCVAVSFEGLIYTSSDPAGGAATWTVADLDPVGPNTHLYGISCPTADFCVGVASKGKIVTSTDPSGGAGAWARTQLPETLELRGVSCPSTGLCVAVGNEGQIVSSTQPLAGAGAWSLAQLPGAAIDRYLFAAECKGGLCITGNTIGTLFTTASPTGTAAAWTATQSKGTVQITGIDCPTASACAAIDNNGDVLTSTDPTGGLSAWTFANIVPYPQSDENDLVEANGIFGVSCPTTSFCVISGSRGRLFTSADPFVPPPVEPTKGKKRKKGKGPKRPRALIGLSPMPTEIRGRTTKVRFRFFAANHASVRGFSCQLDGGKFQRCPSPKTYRVGIGVHHFRVRALSWQGGHGPPAKTQFRVCHPTRLGFCIGAFDGHRRSRG